MSKKQRSASQLRGNVCLCYRTKAFSQQVVARDWCIGGWKQRTCSTVELSVSTAFMYLFRMAKISLLRIWYFLMRSAIFFRGCKKKQKKINKYKKKQKESPAKKKKKEIYSLHSWWSHPCRPAFGLLADGSKSQIDRSVAVVPAEQWWHSLPS